jgi:hypothetical protein
MALLWTLNVFGCSDTIHWYQPCNGLLFCHSTQLMTDSCILLQNSVVAVLLPFNSLHCNPSWCLSFCRKTMCSAGMTVQENCAGTLCWLSQRGGQCLDVLIENVGLTVPMYIQRIRLPRTTGHWLFASWPYAPNVLYCCPVQGTLPC